MFGMLDYRASKLFLVIYFIPHLVTVIITLFAIPYFAYYAAYTYADNIILKILLAIVTIFVSELIILFLFNLFVKTPIKFIFKLFVDIIPHNNRSQEEAESVVFGGDVAMLEILMSQHPKDWNEDEMNRIFSQPTLGRFFFHHNIRERFFKTYEHFKENEGEYYDGESVLDYMYKHYKPSIIEQIINNPIYRRAVISISFLTYLFIFNPLSL